MKSSIGSTSHHRIRWSAPALVGAVLIVTGLACGRDSGEAQHSPGGASPAPASSGAPSEQKRVAAALTRAFPGFIDSVNATTVFWHDGSTMPLGLATTPRDFAAMTPAQFEGFLDNTSIADQFAFRYPAGADPTPPARNTDPGRMRCVLMYKKIYGSSAAEVRGRLVTVAWLPRHGGGSVRFTSVNGAAKALEAVSAELDALPDSFITYCMPTAGTFNWRAVRGTAERLSAHSFGIAIDINTKYSDYWLWAGKKDAVSIPYRNRLPKEVVEIFERHGFVWGGRWYHYDTMHFEYRPEILAGG